MKIFLFDLDGTLSNSHLGIVNSIKHSLGKMKFDYDSGMDFTKFIGPSLVETFEGVFGMSAAETKKAIGFYREYYHDFGMHEQEIFAHVPDLLKDLKNNPENLVGLATAKPTFYAEKILLAEKLTQFFDTIVGSNLDGTRTDKGEVIKFALEQLPKLEQEQVFMIGDRAHDMIGAHENKIQPIGVLYGYGSREELSAHKPIFLAESTADLRGFLNHL